VRNFSDYLLTHEAGDRPVYVNGDRPRVNFHRSKANCCKVELALDRHLGNHASPLNSDSWPIADSPTHYIAEPYSKVVCPAMVPQPFKSQFANLSLERSLMYLAIVESGLIWASTLAPSWSVNLTVGMRKPSTFSICEALLTRDDIRDRYPGSKPVSGEGRTDLCWR
jgi:hypothetical protein